MLAWVLSLFPGVHFGPFAQGKAHLSIPLVLGSPLCSLPRHSHSSRSWSLQASVEFFPPHLCQLQLPIEVTAPPGQGPSGSIPSTVLSVGYVANAGNDRVPLQLCVLLWSG